MTPEEQQRLRKLAARMDEQRRYIEAIFDLLPRLKANAESFDAAITKLLAVTRSRKRGQRGKLHGARSQEDVALHLAKWRRNQLRAEGMPAWDAWDKAKREIAPLFHVTPGTMQEWYNGVNRRYRRKRES
jgi:hypothetical protein